MKSGSPGGPFKERPSRAHSFNNPGSSRLIQTVMFHHLLRHSINGLDKVEAAVLLVFNCNKVLSKEEILIGGEHHCYYHRLSCGILYRKADI